MCCSEKKKKKKKKKKKGRWRRELGGSSTKLVAEFSRQLPSSGRAQERNERRHDPASRGQQLAPQRHDVSRG